MRVEVFLGGGIDWSAWIQAAATTIALAIAIWQMVEAERRNAQQRYATAHAACTLATSAHQTLVPLFNELATTTAAQQSLIAQRILSDGHIATTIQSMTSFDVSRLPTDKLVSRFLLTTENTIAFQNALQQIAIGRAPSIGPTYDELFYLVQRSANEMLGSLMEQTPGYHRRLRRERISMFLRLKRAA